jgi:hypothetical protein
MNDAELQNGRKEKKSKEWMREREHVVHRLRLASTCLVTRGRERDRERAESFAPALEGLVLDETLM